MRGRRYSWGTVEGKARHALRAARELSLHPYVKLEALVLGVPRSHKKGPWAANRGSLTRIAKYSQRADHKGGVEPKATCSAL